ncbi:MAG: tRNA uridine-5-carboxymethylaminomethyl(34) synthesis enzyme MnmG [Myxococcaceae bacterium]
MQGHYDVIVVGLGHAGCEAALAAARMGQRVLALTLRADRIALMSCNPAVGGTAKGHLVREIDALGGEMARAADFAGTHYKTLNASKGPAVRATRVLCDRDIYAKGMQSTLLRTPNLDVREGEVVEICVEQGRATGVTLAQGERVHSRAVVLTTGTFLQARMHVGEEKAEGGRVGDSAAWKLSESLRALGLRLERFKTGTPPRLLAESIDFTQCTPEPGDEGALPFSRRGFGEAKFPRLPQLNCHLTATTPKTHDVVRANLSRSALHLGDIVGQGPRYCPSLEDKVVRFSHRQRHTVFLEPEGLDSPLIYPAGLSTSLPAETQLEFLRTIPGLAQVDIARPGYAVEYDYAPPTQLRASLESRDVPGLFLGGQLNGTSGYEEAAFQGLMAGINAALLVRDEAPLILRRDEAHGAVLLDELVTLGVDEPFRMMTARSEHRLTLREGNADLRLSHHGHRLGLISDGEFANAEARKNAIEAEVGRLRSLGFDARLRRPSETYATLQALDVERPDLPGDVKDEVETCLKYEGYVAQRARALARGRDAWDDWAIPTGLDFQTVRGLSGEAVEKLSKRRPETIGHARRVPGLNPANIDLLLVHLKRGHTVAVR